MISSAGTKPMKMYDNVSFRRTRQRRRRFVMTKRRYARTSPPATRQMSPNVSMVSTVADRPAPDASTSAAAFTTAPRSNARPARVPLSQFLIADTRQRGYQGAAFRFMTSGTGLRAPARALGLKGYPAAALRFPTARPSLPTAGRRLRLGFTFGQSTLQ